MTLLISQCWDTLLETLILQQILEHPVFNFKRSKKILLVPIYNRGTNQQLLEQVMENLQKSGKESQI